MSDTPAALPLLGKRSRYPLNKNWDGHRGGLDVLETVRFLLGIDPRFLAS
jgi:hypothetical protein